MRVGGEGFVGKMKQWCIGDMVGIGADMTLGALQAVSIHPAFHKLELCRIIAIMPIYPRQHMAAAISR